MSPLSSHSEALTSSLASAGLVPGPAEELIFPTSPVSSSGAFQPATHLRVSYGPKEIQTGNFFRAGECKAPPRVAFDAEEAGAAEPGQTYTLILTDGDAPTPDDPKFAWWRHWVVSGLRPGGGGGEGEGHDAAAAGRLLTEYLGPGPKDEPEPSC